jgi:ABC-type polysaccharide/polyol phosphate transport system ATPase subunit
MSVILSCNGVTKGFAYAEHPSFLFQDWLIRRGWRQPTWAITAVDHVTLSVRKGEWVGIYGPNGSGKTTLLRMLARLLPPDEGEIAVRGRMSIFLGLGVGFEPELTAEKNIYLHGLLHGMSAAEIAVATERIIAFAGVESHRRLPIKCYSSGMQLRLAFAATAHVDADIYLLDEVLAVGDSAFVATCLAHLESLRAAGKTVVLVSHDMPRLTELCDRILHLERGRVTAERTKGVDY